jgi:hypothetical protein
MEWIGRRHLNERGLFIFMLMLTALLNLEIDFVGLIAASMQRLIVALLLSYVVYGFSMCHSRAANRLRHVSSA